MIWKWNWIQDGKDGTPRTEMINLGNPKAVSLFFFFVPPFYKCQCHFSNETVVSLHFIVSPVKRFQRVEYFHETKMVSSESGGISLQTAMEGGVLHHLHVPLTVLCFILDLFINSRYATKVHPMTLASTPFHLFFFSLLCRFILTLINLLKTSLILLQELLFYYWVVILTNDRFPFKWVCACQKE